MPLWYYPRCFAESLVRADPVMVMEYLPIEVRLVRRVKIADTDIADTGNGKINRDRGAKPSGTGDKDRRVLDLLLGLFSPAFHHHLARVSAGLFRENVILFKCVYEKDAAV
jgi:hypothetical protein